MKVILRFIMSYFIMRFIIKQGIHLHNVVQVSVFGLQGPG